MTINHETVTRLGQGRLFSRFWRSGSGFWRGPSGWPIRVLTVSLVILIGLQIIVQYRLNFWNRDFFDALQQRNASMLWRQALLFLPLAAASVTLGILSVWGRMTAQRKWREWLTKHLIELWLKNQHYGRLDLVGGEHQNPEFRIAEDARIATDAPIDLALGLLTASLTAMTFIEVLWTVGGDFPIHVFGSRVAIPGYLVMAVVAYSILFTSAMRVIGRNLTHVIEEKNQAEAEFLSEASRLREAGEAGASLASEADERSTLARALDRALGWWWQLCRELMRTTLVSQGNALLAPVVGWVLCAPKFLAGTMSLGELTQAAAAFVMVQGAFNWLVDNYPRLADWLSSVNRVAHLLLLIDELEKIDTLEASGLSKPIGNERRYA